MLLEKWHWETCSTQGCHKPLVHKTRNTVEYHKTRFSCTSFSAGGSEAVRNSGARTRPQVCLALRPHDLAQRYLLSHHCCGQGLRLEGDPARPFPGETGHNGCRGQESAWQWCPRPCTLGSRVTAPPPASACLGLVLAEKPGRCQECDLQFRSGGAGT